jgi:hypothetical protein
VREEGRGKKKIEGAEEGRDKKKNEGNTVW